MFGASDKGVPGVFSKGLLESPIGVAGTERVVPFSVSSKLGGEARLDEGGRARSPCACCGTSGVDDAETVPASFPLRSTTDAPDRDRLGFVTVRRSVFPANVSGPREVEY